LRPQRKRAGYVRATDGPRRTRDTVSVQRWAGAGAMAVGVGVMAAGAGITAAGAGAKAITVAGVMATTGAGVGARATTVGIAGDKLYP
jgi:hypothetical protein